MTLFDRFRAISGIVDIPISQKTHLHQQMLASCYLLESPEISVPSTAARQLRQGGHLKKVAGKQWKQPAAAARAIVLSFPAILCQLPPLPQLTRGS